VSRDKSDMGTMGFRSSEDFANWLNQQETKQPEPVGEEVEVVGAAILGGLFHGGSGPELGDIDLELNPDVLERIQAELVNSSDDVMISLMTVPQHQRIVEGLNAVIGRKNRRIHDFANEVIALQSELEEAKQGQLILAMGAERWKAEVEQLKDALEVESSRLAACSSAALGWFVGCSDQYKSAALEDVLNLRAQLAHKVVLPERKAVPPDYSSAPLSSEAAMGWNACLDEVARLNGAKP
jgi:hypothetical protein